LAVLGARVLLATACRSAADGLFLLCMISVDWTVMTALVMRRWAGIRSEHSEGTVA